MYFLQKPTSRDVGIGCGTGSCARILVVSQGGILFGLGGALFRAIRCLVNSVKAMRKKPTATMAGKMSCFILDVDGVMTTGHFLYTENAKTLKIFGPDDHDGLLLLKPFIEIRFVTGDRSGFAISERRIVKEMEFRLDLVSAVNRIEWIKKRYNPLEVVYMGDGIFDHYVMKEIGYSIAPANADTNAKKYANYITKCSGGDRAVAEACVHLLDKFFEPFDPRNKLDPNTNSTGS